jgi:hypothetical protein
MNAGKFQGVSKDFVCGPGYVQVKAAEKHSFQRSSSKQAIF